ncbi:hypothetical protein KIW84_032417 [Lathyrus oleraceus]|uniref:DUF7745 domain-containing protein n=1 Tax=Pisum sativum TaxID=3888 RepID=A0A9D4XVP1_PEA|nr:hypothetical protein KIW84_032417 [Pisum sativum]
MGSDKKNTLPLKFKLPRVDTLLALSSKITSCKKNNFIYRYRQIMDLLTTYVDVSALVALSQYYDPPLKLFTFKYFQLVPTIEEYKRLLGWYVKDHPPFTKLGELLMPKSVVEALHIFVEENKSLGWLNEKARMNGLLDTYAGSINLLQPVVVMYQANYDFLVRFCNELTKEVPWKLEDALEDAYENTTPYSIL